MAEQVEDSIEAAIAAVSRHDTCSGRGCSVAESLATNSVELNSIIGECAPLRRMRPLVADVRKNEEKTFTLFWRTGDSEIVTGPNIARAMGKAGYGNGALAALDFHAKGDARARWSWDAQDRKWRALL